MFQPNLSGAFYPRTGRDVHGQPVYGSKVACTFAVVNLKTKSQKTSVRADSSASRGSADELSSPSMRILLSLVAAPNIGDKFEFGGVFYDITTRHPRWSVFGILDHIECDMEFMP